MDFKGKSLYFNPVYGLLWSVNLIRNYYHFGSEDDTVTKLVRVLFTGTGNSVVASISDIFKTIPPHDIGFYLAQLYVSPESEKKRKCCDGVEQMNGVRQMNGSTEDVQDMSNIGKTEKTEETEKTEKTEKMNQTLVNVKKFRQKIKKFVRESRNPLIYHVILSFLWHKLRNLEEIKQYFEGLSKGFTGFEGLKPKLHDIEHIYVFFGKIFSVKKIGNPSPKIASNIYDYIADVYIKCISPFSLVKTGTARVACEASVARESREYRVVYEAVPYRTDETEFKAVTDVCFPDCVETTIRNFINFIVFRENNDFPDIDILRENGGIDIMIKYYKIYNTIGSHEVDFPRDFNGKKLTSRDAWALIMSNIEGICYVRKTCEISSNKSNFMRAVSFLFDDIDPCVLFTNLKEKNIFIDVSGLIYDTYGKIQIKNICVDASIDICHRHAEFVCARKQKKNSRFSFGGEFLVEEIIDGALQDTPQFPMSLVCGYDEVQVKRGKIEGEHQLFRVPKILHINMQLSHDYTRMFHSLSSDNIITFIKNDEIYLNIYKKMFIKSVELLPPITLTSLKYDYLLIQDVEFNKMDRSKLEALYLEFDESWNPTKLKWDTNIKLSHDTLPATLTHVKFGPKFDNGNFPLEKNVLPPGLKYCKFNHDIMHPSDQNIFPEDLEHLIFGYSFTNGGIPITREIFPPNLKSLTFCSLRNRDIEPGIFPLNLKSLTFEMCMEEPDKPLRPGMFPETLTHLSLGYSFENDRQPLQPGLFPKTLTHLTFGNEFANGNRPLQIGIFPDTLTHLTFDTAFQNGGKPLDEGVFPTSLKYLDVGFHFKNGSRPLGMNVLPSKLETLILGAKFNFESKSALYPHSLKKIEFSAGSDNYGNSIQSGSFNDSLVYLELPMRFTNNGKPLTRKELPQSLRQLACGHVILDVRAYPIDTDLHKEIMTRNGNLN